MRILAIDVGEKTLGLAISDPTQTIASPLETIRRESLKKDIEQLEKIIHDREVEEIIIGFPRNMNGSAGQQARKVVKFADHLREKITQEILYWDERLTTVAATKVLIEGHVRREKRKKVVDKLAAVLILQGYLESKSYCP